MNIVIMAGGGGTRLWPLSRQSHPKQFLKFDGQRTLLETTYARAAQVVSPHNIYIATNQAYASQVKNLLPQVSEANIFYEPEKRETGPAFAAVVMQLIAKGQGNTPVVFMWSDHVFTAETEYIADIKKMPAILAKHPASLVIMGHIPTSPETGLGYIEAGQAVSDFAHTFEVKSFKEKPDMTTAESYLASGRYYWNIGCISGLPSHIVSELQKFEPDMMATLATFITAQTAGQTEAARQAYAQAKKIAIDYALLEKTASIIVVTGNYGWSDIGNWSTIHDIFGLKDATDPQANHVHVDSKNNYIYNTTNKVVSLIGLQDTIAVVTEDAVLITAKSKAHKVKDLVQKLEADQKHNFL